MSKTYSYLADSGGANASTRLIGSATYSDNTTYSYSYDAVGNITAIKKNGTTIRGYVCYELNQLIRENNHELQCFKNCPDPSAQFNNILHEHQKRRFYQAALFLCLKKDSRIRAAVRECNAMSNISSPF